MHSTRIMNPWWILSMKDQILKFLWSRDSFEGVWDENMQEGGFWINLEEVNFWQFWPSRCILGITKNLCVFWRRIFLGKLYLTSRALKQAKERSKPTSFDPPNVLNKLLSRNPTLTRRCEVNKFNLVTLYKYQPCGTLITQFSRPRATTILSSFSLVFSFSFLLFSTNKLLIIYWRFKY